MDADLGQRLLNGKLINESLSWRYHSNYQSPCVWLDTLSGRLATLFDIDRRGGLLIESLKHIIDYSLPDL